MKKLTILLIIITLLVPKQSKAQNNGAALAAVGGLLAIGAGIAAVEDMKERAELTATQWVLENHPELNSFSLKTLDLMEKKQKICLQHLLFLLNYKNLIQQITQNLMAKNRCYSLLPVMVGLAIKGLILTRFNGT